MKKHSKLSIGFMRSLFAAKRLFTRLSKRLGLADLVTVYDLRLAMYLVFGYVTLSIINVGVIPDWLRLSQNSDPSRVLEVICSVLAGIVAIVVAFVIITFEVLKRKLGPRALKRFFSDKRFARWITLAVVAIALSVVTIMRGNDVSQNSVLTVYYYNAILGCLTFISFYPMCRDVLAMGTEYAHTKMALEDFATSLDHFNSLEMLKYEATDIWDYLARFQENPTITLRDIGISCIREGNSYEAQAIINETGSALISHLGTAPDDNRIYWDFSKLLIIWNGMIFEAIEANERRVLEAVWRTVSRFFSFIAEKKLYIDDFHELQKFVDEYLRTLIDRNYSEQVLMGLNTLNQAIREQFSINRPADEKIEIIYIADGKQPPAELEYKDRRQWDTITRTHVYKLQQWGEDAAKRGDSEAFEAIMSDLSVLFYDAREANIHRHLKTDFAWNLIWTILNLAKKGVDAKLQESPLQTFDIRYGDLRQIIESGDNYYQFATHSYCNFFSYVVTKSEYPITSFDLNNIGTLGRILASLKTERYQVAEALTFIVSYFLVLGRELVQSGRNSPALMKELNSQFLSIEAFYLRDRENPRTSLQMKIDEVKSALATLPQNDEGANDFELRWPDLRPSSSSGTE